MSTLADIKAAVANYFGKTVSDLTVNGQDLFLVAANQVRQLAEMQHDFEFNRKLLTLTFSGSTGGSLLSAVIKGTATTVDIKTFIDVGVFDSDGNLRPTRWSTTIEQLRNETSRQAIPRYPTDASSISPWRGRLSEFVVSGDTINVFPKCTAGEVQNFSVGIEAYVFTPDWTGFGLTSTGTLSQAQLVGSYYPQGIFADHQLYGVLSAGDIGGFIYWDTTKGKWVMNTNFPMTDTDDPCWIGPTTDTPVGSYVHSGIATGTATVVAAVGGVSDVWTNQGSQYIQWATIVQLNHKFKEFVFRQEGNVSDASPKEQAATALDALKTWDAYKYEQFRSRG